MDRLDSWVTETGPDQYCIGAEDCRGRQAPVLSAERIKAAKQWLDCVFQLLDLTLIAHDFGKMNEGDAAINRGPTEKENQP